LYENVNLEEFLETSRVENVRLENTAIETLERNAQSFESKSDDGIEL
jgi:hypothetical protein